MSLLDKLLNKRGIKKTDELTQEERAVYENYERVLKGGVISIEDIKKFCDTQIKIIEGKCDGVTPLTNMQQACMHVYLSILKMLDAPEKERETLERYLTQLINK